MSDKMVNIGIWVSLITMTILGIMAVSLVAKSWYVMMFG